MEIYLDQEVWLGELWVESLDSRRAMSVWKGLRSVLAVFEENIRYRVSSGSKVRSWLDR